jgi:hypothetical protein
MDAGVPPAPTRQEAVEAAAHAVRTAQSTDRDALMAARRLLRDAEKAHVRVVRDAERRLATARRGPPGAAVTAAEHRLAKARAAHRGLEDVRPLLRGLDDLLHGDEAVLDMTPALSAGHDGVLVATSRRVLFLAPRRTVIRAYGDITAVTTRGRRLGTRLIVSTPPDNAVFSGLRPQRAADIADVVRERIAATHAAHDR